MAKLPAGFRASGSPGHGEPADKQPATKHRCEASAKIGMRLVVCQRVNVLGVGLSDIHRRSALELVLAAVENKHRGYICVTGVHGVMEAHDDPQVRSILNNAFLCTPDGMPMVWMGWLQGHREMDRVYGPDLMLDVCQASVARGLRHFFYGGANGVAADLKCQLTDRFPGLQVVGTFEP